MNRVSVNTMILTVEFVIALVFLSLAILRGGEFLHDGACWAGGAFIASLLLIYSPRRFLWVDGAVIVLALLLWWWSITPEPGPNIGKGFVLLTIPWVLTGAPGIAIGAAMSMLYKIGSLVLTRSKQRTTA